MKNLTPIKNMIIGVVYRPSNTDLHNFVDIFNDMTSPINLSKTAGFIDMIYSHSYLPLINKPMRVTNESMPLIDNIYTNCTHNTIERGIFFY